MGLVNEALGDRQKALDNYSEALTIESALGSRAGASVTLGNMAFTRMKLGQLLEARHSLERALKIIESLRIEVISPELRTSYFSSQYDFYSLYVDILMQLHHLHPQDGYDRLAFEASERGKARGLLDLLNEANAHIYRGVDPKLLEREDSLRQQLEIVAQKKTKLLSGSHTVEQLDSLEQRLGELTTDYDQAEAEIRQKSPRYAALKQPVPASVADVQKQLEGADTLLLEYELGEERSYLWLVSSTALISYELPKQEEIKGSAQHLYQALVTARVPADAEYEKAAAVLSGLLVGKVTPLLGHKRLVIVADGSLSYIPFSALPAPSNGNAKPPGSQMKKTPFLPLLIDHEVVHLPSASVLNQLRRGTMSRKVAAKRVFIVADPVFSALDPRVKNSFPAPKAGSAVEGHAEIAHVHREGLDEVAHDQLVRSAQDTDATRDSQSLPRLEGTREEARSIAALDPGQSRLALDFDANRATVTSSELKRYRYVHFATHGLVDTKYPELSGLALSMVNERGEPINGFLRLQDIFNLDLPVELVVLSACETGLGKEMRGEGLIGLTRGFMYAGSPRVVVSLWKVDDTATSDLMRRFYEGMIVQKLSPSAALRAAQLKMWRDSNWRGPYYWAAFVLQGEWN